MSFPYHKLLYNYKAMFMAGEYIKKMSLAQSLYKENDVKIIIISRLKNTFDKPRV